MLSISPLCTRQIRDNGDNNMMGDSDEDSENDTDEDREYDTDESDLVACWDSDDDLSSDEGQPKRPESLSPCVA